MASANPAISIIIPTLNEEDRLPGLIGCLKQQTFTDFELIVADAGSEDSTRRIAREAGALVVDGGLPGVGRNRGAEHARGDYLLFLDADVEIGGDFLGKGMREIRTKDIRLGACETVPLSGRPVDNIIHKFAFLMMKWTSQTNPRAPGYCMFFSRELFERVGGFDEGVRLAEDYDLVSRAAELEPFKILETVQIRVSMRRLDKEGRAAYIGKSVLVYFHRKLKGEVRDDTIEYEFDNFDKENFDESGSPALQKQLSRIKSSLKKIERKLKPANNRTKRFPKKIGVKLEKLGGRLSELLNSNGNKGSKGGSPSSG
jgi:glycosyltransferase involved in cell wall biosynthesis